MTSMPSLECLYDLYFSYVRHPLGSGSQRSVYEAGDNCVLKVAHVYTEQNKAEYNLWSQVKDTKYAKYFAPIDSISPSGHFLWMKRTKPVLSSEFTEDSFKLPKPFKEVLAESDIKPDNLGWYEDRIVLIDYGYVELNLAKVLV